LDVPCIEALRARRAFATNEQWSGWTSLAVERLDDETSELRCPSRCVRCEQIVVASVA
jgi:hypothetical protein